MSHPWERQPQESAPAFAAFDTYRSLGPERSLARVGQTLGKSTDLMERWSTRWGWVARAAAWDDHLAAVARKQEEATRKRQADQRAAAYQMLLGSGATILQKANLTTLTEADARVLLGRAITAIDVGARGHRSETGEPDQVIQIRLVIQQEAERYAALTGIPVEDIMAKFNALVGAK